PAHGVGPGFVRRTLLASAPPDVSRFVWGRAIRGLADGFVSGLLAQYLVGLGFSPVQVGAIVTGRPVGSAALTLAFGLPGAPHVAACAPAAGHGADGRQRH